MADTSGTATVWSIAFAAISVLVLGGCSSPARPAASSTPSTPHVEPVYPPTKIVAFAVSNENLNVDKVGLRDGSFKPDGNRDFAFTATIEGPFEALFVLSVDKKGEPAYGLRADTLTGSQDIPAEFGGTIDTGKMTPGVGVIENGKFINGETGNVRAEDGVHQLKLYVPNSATLNPGSFVRLYARTPSGGLVAGPVAAY